MYDSGTGTAVVIVQPLQGRWQWMRPFLDALARQCRVVTYTPAGDFGADRSLDEAQGFDQFVRQLADVMDRAGLARAALCGVSFGGVVAVRFASLHPDRVTRLIIAVSPGPGWRANPEQSNYLSRPLLTLPLFLTRASLRVRVELAASFPRGRDQLAFLARIALRALRHPASPRVMAKRARLMEAVDLTRDCARITAPTLVVTGDPALDLVVPVESTLRYLSHIRGSRYEMMDTTGHSGSLTQPDRFARIVGSFVNAHTA